MTDLPLEKMYRAVFEYSMESVLLTTPDGSVLAANPAACALFRLGEAEICKAGRAGLVDPASPQLESFLAERALSGKARAELVFIRGDAVRFPAEVSSAQFTNDRNEVRTIMIIHDLTKRNQAEELARASEEKFRKAFMTGADAFYLATFYEGRIIEVNDSFSNIFGYSREEAIGKTSLELGLYADPIDRKKWVSNMETTGQIRNLRLRGKRKSGEAITILLSVSLLSGSGEKIILGVAKDITETVFAQNALQVSESKYRTLFESADDAILLYADHAWVDCNAGALRMFGCTREQIIGSNPARFSPPTQPDGQPSTALAIEKIELAYANKPQAFMWVHCKADGSLFDAEVHLNRVDLDGVPFIMAVVRDVSARMRAERALRDSNEKLRKLEAQARGILEDQAEIISRLTGDGVYIYANEVFLRFFGKSEADLIGSRWQPIVHPDDLVRVGNELAKLSPANPLVMIENRVFSKTGQEYWMEFSNRGLFDSAGHLAEIQSVGRDITKRKQVEEALRTSLEQSVRAMSDTVEARDPYTAGHQHRVAEIAVAIAREMGLSDDQIHGISLAASIHDLGKIAVPAEILVKPSRLSEIEYMLIKGHPEAGYNILKDIEYPWPIAEIVRQHHEKMDGTGYPRGLKQDQILPEARILMVADVVEAMASHRPYRAGLGIEFALTEIVRGRGTAYDPVVADACLRIFHEGRFTLK